MTRFILSAFSVLLVAGAVSPTVQALPKVDPTFELQTLRLSELDDRNKSEDIQQHQQLSVRRRCRRLFTRKCRRPHVQSISLSQQQLGQYHSLSNFN